MTDTIRSQGSHRQSSMHAQMIRVSLAISLLEEGTMNPICCICVSISSAPCAWRLVFLLHKCFSPVCRSSFSRPLCLLPAICLLPIPSFWLSLPTSLRRPTTNPWILCPKSGPTACRVAPNKTISTRHASDELQNLDKGIAKRGTLSCITVSTSASRPRFLPRPRSNYQ